jgi:hypothetical protein
MRAGGHRFRTRGPIGHLHWLFSARLIRTSDLLSHVRRHHRNTRSMPLIIPQKVHCAHRLGGLSTVKVASIVTRLLEYVNITHSYSQSVELMHVWDEDTRLGYRFVLDQSSRGRRLNVCIRTRRERGLARCSVAFRHSANITEHPRNVHTMSLRNFATAAILLPLLYVALPVLFPSML